MENGVKADQQEASVATVGQHSNGKEGVGSDFVCSN